MKKYLLGLLNLFICGIVIVLLLIPISELLEPKRVTMGNENQMIVTKGLYNEPKNSIDVLFLGDSNLYRSVNPIVLWDNYGITSYVYGSPNQKAFVSYYVLRDALDRQDIKTVVINIDTLFDSKRIRSGSIAKAFDDMENIDLKIEAMFNKDLQTPFVEKFSYIFKVFRYHYRYRELSSEDLEYFYKKDIHNPFKGYEPTFEIDKAKTNDLSYMKKRKKIKVDKDSLKYLDKISNLCKEKNINLILIEVPSYKTWSNNRSEYVKKYAKDKNITFIDLNIKEVNIDWYKDTKDKGYHLNTNGANKVSLYLGKKLSNMDNYNNRKNDKISKKWNKDSEFYDNFVKKNNK